MAGDAGAVRRAVAAFRSLVMNASFVDTAACSPVSTHPLEMFPFFRRFRRSVVRDLVYTAIWNTLFALVFAALAVVIDPRASLLGELRQTFVFAQCIGYMIHLLFMAGEGIGWGQRVMHAKMWVRAAYFSAIPIVAIFPGYLLGFRLLNMRGGPEWLMQPRSVALIVAVSMLMTSVLLMIFIPRERAAKAEAAMAREQARVAAAEKAAETARFKLLEAQVEPHYLYNTLAHVVSLVDAEPAAAKRMIERLIALLRATASGATEVATLGAQVEWLRAYLDILELRMGARLAWRIDVAPELSALRVPPMLLQPLVENAVKHGLEPSIDGGMLSIAARREDDRLVLEVADTGRGIRAMAPRSAPGLGLANLRARLAALYGDAARIGIEDNAPQGTRVTVALPYPSPAATAATAATAAATVAHA